MSKIFRTKEWMTVAQLGRCWAGELATAEVDRQQSEHFLLHTLMEDIINGRLDNAGPSREDQRSGLSFIMAGNKPRITEGRELCDLFPLDPANRWMLDHIVVMKEAVLDFAVRRELPAPSWWTSSVDAPTTFSIPGSTLATPIAKVEPRNLGKTPRIRQYLAERYPEGVPAPGHCPRKALKDKLIEWDRSLSPLDGSTLKKAIDEHNTRVMKPQS